MKTEQMDVIRNQLMDVVVHGLERGDFESMLTASGTVAVPVTVEGEEGWATVTVVVKKGSRNGDAYDGYAEAAAYQTGLAKKIADAAAREAKSQAKQAERKAKDEAKAAKVAAAKVAE